MMVPTAWGRRGLLGAALTAPLAGCVGGGPTAAGPRALRLGRLAVSPDEETIAFEFAVPVVNEYGVSGLGSGIGLYVPRTGALTRVPSPSPRRLSTPTFTPDGRGLLCLDVSLGPLSPTGGAAQGVFLVDLRSFATRVVAAREDPSEVFESNAVLTPTGGHVLFAARTNSQRRSCGLYLQPLRGGPRELLLRPEEGFRSISALAYAGPGRIVFHAMSPTGAAEQAQVVPMRLGPLGVALWQMAPGGRPRLLLPQRPEQRAPANASPEFDTTSVAASADGAVVVTTARSRTEPLGPRGRFQSEVHRIAPDGMLTPLTAVRGRLGRVAISARGSVVAFLDDPERRDAFDLVTLDVASGAVTRHGLLARVAADEAFRTT